MSYRGSLRHSITLDDGEAHDVLDSLLHFGRERRGPEEADPQRRQIVVCHAWILGQAKSDRWNREQHGDPVSREKVQELIHVEPAHHDLGAARSYGAVHQNVHAVDVEQGQVRQQDVVGANDRGFVLTVQELLDVSDQVVVREHHTLGEARGAGRVG